MKHSHSTETQHQHAITITRTFDAPRELVWKAWTEAEHIAKWYGPRGFTTRVEEHDFRPGGRFRYVMIGPDGAEYPSVGVFREITPMERFVSTDEFGEDFKHPDFPDLPRGIVVTFTFEEVEGGTRVSIHMAHPTEEDRSKHEKMGVVAGWSSSLDCLEEHLVTIA